jgi:hypothetical protein
MKKTKSKQNVSVSNFSVNENKKNIIKPKTVEQFRENLKKYYVCSGDSLMIKTTRGKDYFISINDINSFSDIYQLTETGFFYRGKNINGNQPMITPMVEFDINFWEGWSFWYDEENYKLWIDKNQFFKECYKPIWFSLDNTVLREFYCITLGEFCGYC